MNRLTLPDRNLMHRYCLATPLYLCYPNVEHFDAGLGEKAYRACVQRTNEDLIPAPLSLSVNMPMLGPDTCDEASESRRARLIEKHLYFLSREIETQGRLFDRDRVVQQISLHGDGISYLNHRQIHDLIGVISRHFGLSSSLAREYEVAITLDKVDECTLSLWQKLGFNHLTLVVQPLGFCQQSLISVIDLLNRSPAILATKHTKGFCSLNFLLDCGAFDDQASSAAKRTMEQLLPCNPDRVLLRGSTDFQRTSLGHIDAAGSSRIFNVMQEIIASLERADYIHIGLELFARSDSHLASAQRTGKLTYALGKFVPHPGCDWIGLGVGGLSSLNKGYFQNACDPRSYYERIDAGLVPVSRGSVLSNDDDIRGTVINELLCCAMVDLNTIQERFEIPFSNYFDSELKELESMQAEGLVSIEEGMVRIRPQGRLLVRSICRVFDRYHKQAKEKTVTFPATVPGQQSY